MAKINHNNFLDTVDHIWTTAKEKGIMHLNSQETFFDGTFFDINEKRYVNFGTCGYLGLEKHPALIEGATDLLKRFGTQLSMSRAYVRPPYIQELEELISQIFQGNKAIVYTSTSTAHLSVIGTLIKPDDLIILDQQVHYSVQYPCKFAKLQGTEVKMVRHSNYDLLEDMLKEESNKFTRIWYMADGVYSMHGDIPNTDRLKELMNKYPKLHLYFDDAHGMGWGGTNGAGNIFEKLGVSDRIILISTLAKGFGCVGGTAIFANTETYRKIDTYGGILTYTHPLTPANVGSAIASAKLHLSPEIYEYQAELRGLMDYMNRLLVEKNITNTSSPDAPIYFIGAGSSKVTHNLVNRILGEGIYVNTATFPVVPNDKSGLRFTLTRHNTMNDVQLLADALAYHLPLAIEEEGDDRQRVYDVFNIPLNLKETKKIIKTSDISLKTEVYTTIQDIDAQLWDKVMVNKGNFNHSGMQCMEEIFSGNEKLEENWSFHYLLVKDEQDELILATFFTGAIYKDDMLALENKSKKIEEIRKNDPYYLCSKTLAMGSLFAEGEFLYLNKGHKQWKEALNNMFVEVDNIKQSIDAKVIVLRDFEEKDPIAEVLENEGYTKLEMPNTNIIENPKWETYDELLNLIDSKKRKDHIKNSAIKKEKYFEINYLDEITPEKAALYYALFKNVKNKNFAFNFFTYPEKTPAILSKYKDWEFIEICFKETKEIVGCGWSFKGENSYSPLIAGLNYKFQDKYQIYKQIIFQTVKRANMLNKSKVFCGLSADYEKQKYGANTIKKNAFLKFDDTYNLELIENIFNN
jgi:7-keto-8-aminopelargonate synthetase-like enzyme